MENLCSANSCCILEVIDDNNYDDFIFQGEEKSLSENRISERTVQYLCLFVLSFQVSFVFFPFIMSIVFFAWFSNQLPMTIRDSDCRTSFVVILSEFCSLSNMYFRHFISSQCVNDFKLPFPFVSWFLESICSCCHKISHKCEVTLQNSEITKTPFFNHF